MRWLWPKQRKAETFILPDHSPALLQERDERLAWMMRHQRGMWKLINGNIIAKGDPVAMAEGTYGALGAYPLPAALSPVTATTTIAGLMTAAQSAVYLPIPANGLLAPQAYRFVIAGLTTLTTTAANYTWTIFLGNSTSGVSLGASAAVAKTATAITNAFWVIKADLTIQSVGAPGANAKAIGHFQCFLNGGAIGGAYTSWLWGTGATAASFDSTVSPNSGTTGGQIFPAVTASAAAADTFTVQQVHYMDWN